MNDQIENIYNLIEQGEAEEASKAIYKYLISDISDLPKEWKSYLISNPPVVFTANGFDCEIPKDTTAVLNKKYEFQCNDNGPKLHIAVERAISAILSVTYWLEPKQ